MRQEHVRPISQHEIGQGFRSLGLSEGLCVEVHSSLSSFGHVQGGADTIIAALMNVLGTRRDDYDVSLYCIESSAA